MRFVDLIRKKRDNIELTGDEIKFVIERYTKGEAPDYQMSAWLMAVVLRGMSAAELAALTEAMLRSGDVLDLSDILGLKVDKHSTGGVGDKTSLVLVPIVAAAGLTVPMISGRGLGHTGGTLDKLEAIPGFNVNLTLQQFRQNLRRCGCAMMGQTAEIAPADKMIYALRDVTATVESQYLICASIMSKKLAEGSDALILDVKTGSGAFMKDEADAVSLAQLMVATGKRMGKRVMAVITDMDQPLGAKVGNALEVEECIDLLRDDPKVPEDLRRLCLELAGWMLVLGERAESVEAGRTLAQGLLSSGAALSKFREMVEAQGGDPRCVDDYSRFPRAAHELAVTSPASGVVRSIKCESIGVASLVLGGGREKKEDAVDPAVGLVVHKKVGQTVNAGEAICTLHYNSSARLKEAATLVEQSYTIDSKDVEAPRALVRRVIE